MTLDILSDYSRFAQLEGEWEAWGQELPGTTPFQVPQWQLTWWRHFGSGELRVMVFREREEMAAIIPCFLHCWNGKRQMTLIGSGISDYLEPLIRPGAADAVLTALSNYLDANGEWDVCVWQDLCDASPLIRLEGHRFRVERFPETECSAIRLSADFDEYWQARSYDLKRNLRRYRARAETEVKLELAVTDKADETLIDTLIALHAKRWRKHGQPGMVEANASADFLRDAAPRLAGRGMLRLFSLRASSEVIAVIFAMPRGRSIFAYLTGFSPDWDKFGIGRILLYEALRYSSAQGYERWDFLRGNENYKSSWGAEKIARSRIVVTRTG